MRCPFLSRFFHMVSCESVRLPLYSIASIQCMQHNTDYGRLLMAIALHSAPCTTILCTSTTSIKSCHIDLLDNGQGREAFISFSFSQGSRGGHVSAEWVNHDQTVKNGKEDPRPTYLLLCVAAVVRWSSSALGPVASSRGDWGCCSSGTDANTPPLITLWAPEET